MDERLEIGAVMYPLVRHAQGGPAPDNNALLVEAATADGEPVRFALSLADVQHFVAFLLISVGKIGVVRGDRISDGPIGQCLPVPATSIAIGQPEGDEGYLGIAVGDAEIVFSIPLSAFGELGRTLLTLSAKPNGPYSA
jgi:hypothetical protein